MDNKEFVVNGRTKKQLKIALDLLLINEYDDEIFVKGWYINPEKGLVLTWMPKEGDSKPFTNNMGKEAPISKEELLPLLWEWLDSDEAKTISTDGQWEGNKDHDGHNEKGWKLYTEDWGHINREKYSIDSYSICAFKPIYCWYGK